MHVMGIDFTSSPNRKKPITCVHCFLRGSVLQFSQLENWLDFEPFEQLLNASGSWIAGIDFPFGQARTFVENIGWPRNWADYVKFAGSLSREEFRATLNTYRKGRPFGDKEHRRATDIAASSLSPQKLYGVPVGLMFHEGAPRLVRSGVTIPHLQAGDSSRVVVEAYPGALARQFVGRATYKNDKRRKQTEEQLHVRRDLFKKILNGKVLASYGLTVIAPETLVEDPSGDQMDALLCAIQGGWAWTMREHMYGAPSHVDPLEGWIADPSVR